MSTEVVNDLLQMREQPLDDSTYLAETTRVLSVIVFVYNVSQKTLQYSPSQIAVELGYAANVIDPDSFKIGNILHEEDRIVFDDFLRGVSEGNTITETNCRLLHSNGSYVGFHVRAMPGNDAVIITATNHASMLTKTDTHLVQANTTIDKLQHSNRELEDFAYVASHDLQAPLRKISTFSDRLQEKFAEELNEEGRMYLQRIIASAENMRMFIDNLLDFSRISRVKEPFTTVDLNVVLKQVKNDFEILIEETNTTISTTQLPTVDGNPAQLKQLLANIISNAIKFRRQGVKPAISIKLHEISVAERAKFLLGDKSYFKIGICDNGIGFEPEYAERIFEVFERLHGKSEYPGTGIGLAICQKIAAYHGGVLFAENNNDNGGACFNIILPVAQD